MDAMPVPLAQQLEGKAIKQANSPSIFRVEAPFSSQKFSPKNFHLPFEHMYEALNVIE
jgi:hypothetical protein